jgi:hypothetical protein
VLHHELKLLEPTVRTLRRLIVVFRASARSLLGLLLIRTTETIDLLAKAPNLFAKTVDDRIELRVEVIGVARETSRFFRARKYRLLRGDAK